MTYKITSFEVYDGSSFENIYYTDMIDIEEAIDRFNIQLKDRQFKEPKLIEYIIKIERLNHVKILN